MLLKCWAKRGSVAENVLISTHFHYSKCKSKFYAVGKNVFTRLPVNNNMPVRAYVRVEVDVNSDEYDDKTMIVFVQKTGMVHGSNLVSLASRMRVVRRQLARELPKGFKAAGC